MIYPLGTLCVVSSEERKISKSHFNSLKILGKQIEHLLELRKTKILLEAFSIDLQEKNIELEKFADVAAHDIKSPLNKIRAYPIIG
ncbi:MAG: light-regulated signal transduction histidine kinase (bacteriophytochrome) [Sphingobacteriales bacterium]|jgi:light-regulated signal transduction histidine kinase (bacteriophytochrome)